MIREGKRGGNGGIAEGRLSQKSKSLLASRAGMSPTLAAVAKCFADHTHLGDSHPCPGNHNSSRRGHVVRIPPVPAGTNDIDISMVLIALFIRIPVVPHPRLR